MSKNIRLSEKHGVNSTIPLCYFCLQEKNEVILAGRLPDDAKAPKSAVWDQNPCDKCRGFMDRGVILISVKDGESGDNPHRTGGWIVVSEDFVKRAISQPLQDQLLKQRAGFVADKDWDIIGFPRGAVEGIPSE